MDNNKNNIDVDEMMKHTIYDNSYNGNSNNAAQNIGSMNYNNQTNMSSSPTNNSNNNTKIVIIVVCILIAIGFIFMIAFGAIFLLSVKTTTDIVDKARDSSYQEMALTYINAARSIVNEGKDILFYKENTLLLIPMGHDSSRSCRTPESGGQSPYSDKYKMIYVGVEEAIAVLNGATDGLPKKVVVPADVITPENAAEFYFPESIY